jgi:hypothetical protein
MWKLRISAAQAHIYKRPDYICTITVHTRVGFRA